MRWQHNQCYNHNTKGMQFNRNSMRPVSCVLVTIDGCRYFHLFSFSEHQYCFLYCSPNIVPGNSQHLGQRFDYNTVAVSTTTSITYLYAAYDTKRTEDFFSISCFLSVLTNVCLASGRLDHM